MTTGTRAVAAAGPVAGLLLLLFFSVRLFVADVLATQPSLHARETALHLVPSNVSYNLAVADARRQRDLDVREQLLRATRANPVDARLLIQLGLECERAGDLASALRYLTEATRFSHEYLPYWTLANYYFRRDDPSAFLIWMRRALDVGTTDMRPAFRLLWTSGLDPARIKTAIPETRDVLLAYLSWLVDQRRLDIAGPVAAIVLNRWPRDGAEALRSYCAALSPATTEQGLQAADLWNALSTRGILQQEPVFPARPPHVVNAGFAEARDLAPFGWARTPETGIVIANADHGLVLRFDGSEPEACRPLSQLLSLRPAASYTLQCEYDSSGVPRGSGLGWRIENASDDKPVPQQPHFFNDDEHFLTIPFTTPPHCRFARLALVYARQPGTVRISGSLQLKHVDLKF